MSISNKDLELKLVQSSNRSAVERLQSKSDLAYISQYVLTSLHLLLWVALENHIIVINPTNKVDNKIRLA